jgi:hypothetical protein
MRSGEHACLVFDDGAAFRDRAAAFLFAGQVAGARLAYLGSGSAAELEAQLRTSAGLRELLDSGQLAVRSLSEQYGLDDVIVPDAPVAAYATATQAALADGYTGLRVVAEATALVRTPAQREAFARYEHLVDRYMVDHPFDAMCAYDSRRLGPAAVAELACLHPTTDTGATPFRWCASPHADAHLAGEVDIASHEVFDRTLARTMPLLDARSEIEARELAFIDHRGMLTLERHALAARTQVTLVTDTPAVHRLGGLLGLTAVDVRWSR